MSVGQGTLSGTYQLGPFKWPGEAITGTSSKLPLVVKYNTALWQSLTSLYRQGYKFVTCSLKLEFLILENYFGGGLIHWIG